MKLCRHALLGLVSLAVATPVLAAPPDTLSQALAEAYANNPTLQAERAKLRATDEAVPTALAGWRPTITLTGSQGFANGDITEPSLVASTPSIAAATPTIGHITVNENRAVNSATVTLTQPIFSGGRTSAQTAQAVDQVRAETANLIATEQQVFQQVVSAYVSVITDEHIVALDLNDIAVLTKQLEATETQFRIGQLTRTDVAQAEAALAGARATLETDLGNLATARATFRQMVGEEPGNLVPPQPLALPVHNQAEAEMMAVRNNPSVVAALFNDAAAKDAVDLAWSKLMPQIALIGTATNEGNPVQRDTVVREAKIIAQLTMPIYQGGAEYAAIRQARQTEEEDAQLVLQSQNTARQAAAQAWSTLISAGVAVASTRTQIRANQIAVEGVEREELLGTRTLLDVLNAVQALLTSEVTLVQNLSALVNASYSVAAAIGRLTAVDLGLKVPLYDPNYYYRQVKDLWFGTGDYSRLNP